MIRFWITFHGTEKELLPLSLGWGCGVTASDLEEALEMIKSELADGGELPEILDVVENIDVSKLDPKIVRHGIGVCVRPGVWWPRVNL